MTNWETEYYQMRSERDELLITNKHSKYKGKYDSLMDTLGTYMSKGLSRYDFVTYLWSYHYGPVWINVEFLKNKELKGWKFINSVGNIIIKVFKVILWVVTLPLRIPLAAVIMVIDVFLAIFYAAKGRKAKVDKKLDEILITWEQFVLRNKWLAR